MAEGARLESVYTLIRIEGSNPSLSAINKQTGPAPVFFIYTVKAVMMRAIWFDNLSKKDWTLEHRDDAPQG